MAWKKLDLTIKPDYPNAAFMRAQGVGFTSQRTRDRLITRLMEKGIRDVAVLEAMRVLPRHLFMDEALANRSYEDCALPIGYGQTISQPWVVAKMTEWVRAGRVLNKVLDIGTGSGYQAALLALLAKRVYSVERIAPLQQRAAEVLSQLELDNVVLNLADGHWGWTRQAPYDAIVCAAAPPSLPQTLLAQLKEGGRLILPIGEEVQQLVGYEKTATGVVETVLADVVFVPLKTGVAP
ncbi:MAG: protein-L-isoaspartate(D-aspartate) O-methyltransferase [Thiomicrospira sp.]|jgi:protein-L-isoaspartate(D-aspartate) O-methyltransferase|nr:protein-L-isoaspartate(D-aspartate) O-methyltransferase [Thiomicrospira sp.]